MEKKTEKYLKISMGMIFLRFSKNSQKKIPPEGKKKREGKKKTEKSDSVEVGRRAYVITWKNKNNTPLFKLNEKSKLNSSKPAINLLPF